MAFTSLLRFAVEHVLPQLPDITEAPVIAAGQRYLWAGLLVHVEVVAGSVRSGTAPDGTSWEVLLQAHYGEFPGSDGADGEAVDVYIGPISHAAQAFIIDQLDVATGAFDEHKVMLGYTTAQAACAAYDAGFSDGKGPQRRGALVALPLSALARWLDGPGTRRPAAAQFPSQAVVFHTAPPTP